jgi:hypothetical protein
MTLCRTCNKPVDNPYRRRNTDGNIVEGCVAEDHSGQIFSTQDDLNWHNRYEAVKIRNAIITGLLYDEHEGFEDAIDLSILIK